MNVDPDDGVCRSCGGPLQIIDARKTSATVACVECSDTYEIDDAPHVHSLVVPIDMLAKRLMEEDANGSEHHPA